MRERLLLVRSLDLELELGPALRPEAGDAQDALRVDLLAVLRDLDARAEPRRRLDELPREPQMNAVLVLYLRDARDQ